MQEPGRNASWYGNHLGLVTNDNGSLFEFREAGNPDALAYLQWSTFPETTECFAPWIRGK